MTIPEDNTTLYESISTAKVCHVLDSLNLQRQLFLIAETVVITVAALRVE